MRDENLMLALLREMAESDEGITIFGGSFGGKRQHNAQLLVDQGSAEWIGPSKTILRITNDGYDRLNIYNQGVKAGGPTVRAALSPGSPNTIDEIWERIVAHEGETFMTFRDLPFTYRIAGDYNQKIRVFRGDHEIRREISKESFHRALAHMPCDTPTDLPDQGLVGRSYIWGILIDARIWLENTDSRNTHAPAEVSTSFVRDSRTSALPETTSDTHFTLRAKGDRNILIGNIGTVNLTVSESKKLATLIEGHNNPTEEDPVGQGAWTWIRELIPKDTLHSALCPKQLCLSAESSTPRASTGEWLRCCLEFRMVQKIHERPNNSAPHCFPTALHMAVALIHPPPSR